MGAGATAVNKAATATNATAAAGRRGLDAVAMKGRAVFSGADDEDEE